MVSSLLLSSSWVAEVLITFYSVSAGLFFDVVFGYVTALAPNYDIFAVSRFFVGIVNGGMALVSFVLTQEYVGKSFWSFTGGIWDIFNHCYYDTYCTFLCFYQVKSVVV